VTLAVTCAERIQASELALVGSLLSLPEGRARRTVRGVTEVAIMTSIVITGASTGIDAGECLRSMTETRARELEGHGHP
jgi:hypothetical protein